MYALTTIKKNKSLPKYILCQILVFLYYLIFTHKYNLKNIILITLLIDAYIIILITFSIYEIP